MYDITVISIIVACIVSLVRANGGIQFILDLIKSRIRGKRGAQAGIAALALLVDLCTANNTVAIVMSGPIAKEICDEFGVEPKRSASLLDMFTSVGQGLIPYGAQLLSAATLTGLTPFDMMPYLIYPILMAVCGIGAIIISNDRNEEVEKMNLLYNTRNSDIAVTASEAILKGLAADGGLFVPERIPKLDVTMDQLKGMSYQETAYAVMKQFLTDFTEEELKHCIDSAYDSKFDTEVIAPLVKVEDTYHLELFHGATIAFKDMALSILPHLLTTAAKKNHVTNEIVILTATSGDTGKAALAGFADVPGTKIIVFYPKGGVSRVQELQMVTQK